MRKQSTADEQRSSDATALEAGFPILELSELAQRESWRKEINRPLSHIHKWWATRLGSVFRGITLGALRDADTDIWCEFYERHSLSGKVVLDPFMGSGTTLGEALKLGARAIGCDSNPVSTFLVRQALTRVDEEELRKAFAELEEQVEPEIRRYYETADPSSGQNIPVLYFFWCMTVTTPSGDVLPLFSRYVFAKNSYPERKPEAWVVCTGCWNILECRYDATVVECPHCARKFDPQDGPADGQHVKAPDGSRYRIKDLLPDGSPPDYRLYAMLALRPNGEKVYLPARASASA